MKLRDVRTAQVKNKRVLLRTDYDIETDERGRIRDNYRMKSSLPTIHWLLRHGAAVIIVAHRGRPAHRQPSFSLRTVVRPLAKLVGRSIRFVDHPIYSKLLLKSIESLKPGEIILLENIRFEPGEERNDVRLSKRLGSLADIYVNDSFANDHRNHASTVGVTRQLPSYAGLHVQEEYRHLSSLLGKVRHPYVAILGGAKISTKLKVIQAMLKRADFVLLGGALANTMLRAQGLAVGKSVIELSMIRTAKKLSVTNPKLKIPVDVVVAQHPAASAKRTLRAVGNVMPQERILDIGADTIQLYGSIIAKAKTVVWNGPMGLYEIPVFARGTNQLAKRIAAARATSYAGGGETVDAIRDLGLAKKFTFVSSGGGAMMELLEGKRLPGLQAVSTRV